MLSLILSRRQTMKTVKTIMMILKTKAHLIDGAGWPPEFTRFITSATIWNIYCSREHEPWLPEHVKRIEEIQWPNEFQVHIFAKTEQLKTRLDALLSKYKAS